MTKEELEKKLEELEERKFIINMVDHWQREDYILYANIQKEIKEVQEQLSNL